MLDVGRQGLDNPESAVTGVGDMSGSVGTLVNARRDQIIFGEVDLSGLHHRLTNEVTGEGHLVIQDGVDVVLVLDRL